MTSSNVSGSKNESVWATARAAVAERRRERELRHRVERELASYTSPADVQELHALLERSAEDSDSLYFQMIERVCLRAA